MKTLFENFYQQLQQCLRGEKNPKKPKSTYIFYIDGVYFKKQGSLRFLSAYSPSQAVCVLKTLYPEYRFKDVEAIDYAEMLKKRKIPPTPTPNPKISKPEQLDMFRK